MNDQTGVKHVALRLPDELHAQLKALAKRQERSVHAQILWLLRQALAAEIPKRRKGGDA
jgi:hypothetical protein